MRRAALIAGVLCALAAEISRAQESDPFTELHARARAVEKTLETMRAEFVETTESDLLAEPIVERGTMVAVRPMKVLLHYREPEEKFLFIDDEQLRLIWSGRGHQESLEIGRIQDAVDKYFYQASEEELRSHFDVSVELDPETPGTHHVVMIAKRKQVKKGLDRMELWISDETLYLVKMRLVYPNGVGGKTIEIDNLRANVPVDDSEFDVTLPAATDEDPTLPQRQ